jgi:hypothetical protein
LPARFFNIIKVYKFLNILVISLKRESKRRNPAVVKANEAKIILSNATMKRAATTIIKATERSILMFFLVSIFSFTRFILSIWHVRKLNV